MRYLRIDQLLQLNKTLSEQHPGLKLHLHDTCGAQSGWVEIAGVAESPGALAGFSQKRTAALELPNDLLDGFPKILHQELQQEFNRLGLGIVFLDSDPLAFSITDQSQ